MIALSISLYYLRIASTAAAVTLRLPKKLSHFSPAGAVDGGQGMVPRKEWRERGCSMTILLAMMIMMMKIIVDCDDYDG